MFRHDRNRHGGGVLLYVKDCFRAVMPSSFVPIYNLEFLPIFIHYFGHKFCISVFYRHPNSSAYIFDTLNPSNAKHFWKTVKTLSKTNSCVSFLTHNGNPCSSDSNKANAMIVFF